MLTPVSSLLKQMKLLLRAEVFYRLKPMLKTGKESLVEFCEVVFLVLFVFTCFLHTNRCKSGCQSMSLTTKLVGC
jgi:hypothetical protein